MKIKFLVSLVFLLTANMFAATGRQDAQYTYNILSPGTTSYIIAISSTSAYGFSYSNQLKGVQRTTNIENDTLGIRCQIGGSSTTVLTNGEYLMPRSWSCFDTSMDTMWLQAPAGSASVNVSLTKIEKQ